ncbi:MAG: NADH-quinone oxidoreductase subunit NuoF [Acidobacteria bacterium]|nr:NADH-quinone oxidoreductase subunit NuoF [Acidobacteriota bacterium]
MEKPLTGRMRSDGEPVDLQEYERAGGYQAIQKALGRMTPKQVQEEVQRSNLRGRGGAGFGTGLKWSFVPIGPDAPRPKYVVCNADEMEPGTFKDRLLMERDPHQLIEGIILTSYAVEAEVAYLFLRGEYTLAEDTLARAISDAYRAGYWGRNIAGTGYNLDLYLHTSAGRYICGEETALLNALEGKRANPRAKPPFPPVVGLWGKPTVINNVETLCNVPHIIRNGADWFRALSRSPDGGTKLFGASGRVKRPGIWELPMGVTIREVIEEPAGGMQDGYALRGLQPGGASTDFLTTEHLDVALDFNSIAKVGSRLGTGTMIILDDRTCPVGMTLNLTHFFAQESCGWCTPCWAGLSWCEQILAAIEKGNGRSEDLGHLEFQTRFFGLGNTFCALAPGAAEPIQSALKYFRQDFQKHIDEKRCPWKG